MYWIETYSSRATALFSRSTNSEAGFVPGLVIAAPFDGGCSLSARPDIL